MEHGGSAYAAPPAENYSIQLKANIKTMNNKPTIDPTQPQQRLAKEADKPFECARCSREIEEDEVYSDEAGSTYCQECYYEEITFGCEICEEREEKEHQHRYLLIHSPDECFREEGKKPGVYRITRKPYFVDGMIDAWVMADRVEWVRDIPDGVIEGCYPAGHLCRQCVKEYIPINPETTEVTP